MAPLVDGFRVMAEDRNEPHEFNEGHPGAFVHRDGWGSALFSGGRWAVRKSLTPCYRDPGLEELKAVSARGVLLHARLASVGEHTLANTHPFQAATSLGEFVFAHNGTIRDRMECGGWLSPQDETDSERYFHLILSALAADGVAGIPKALSRLQDFTGANFILGGKDTAIVGVHYRTTPRYYTMKLGMRPGMVVVSSERIPLDGVAWRDMTTSKVISVDLDRASVGAVG